MAKHKLLKRHIGEILHLLRVEMSKKFQEEEKYKTFLSKLDKYKTLCEQEQAKVLGLDCNAIQVFKNLQLWAERTLECYDGFYGVNPELKIYTVNTYCHVNPNVFPDYIKIYTDYDWYSVYDILRKYLYTLPEYENDMKEYNVFKKEYHDMYNKMQNILNNLHTLEEVKEIFTNKTIQDYVDTTIYGMSTAVVPLNMDDVNLIKNFLK